MHIDNMNSGVVVININIHPVGSTSAKKSFHGVGKSSCAKNVPAPNDLPLIIQDIIAPSRRRVPKLVNAPDRCTDMLQQHLKRRICVVAHINYRTMFYGISMSIWLILSAQSMGKLAKSLKYSIWYVSKF